jgi:glycosyltransferase involved in cell wall biosynthesis
MAIVNTALTLQDLPAPPEGKTGWPWTEQSKPLPDKMPDGSEWPKISIVTPNYNYGQFIEATIRSVLLQGYPNLEYIVIDGGSTDNSVEVIKKYKHWLSCWVSEKDKGQAHAVNKGFSRATGNIFNWVNSDDLLLPMAVNTAAIYLKNEIDELAAVYGCRLRINELEEVFDVDIPPQIINSLMLRLGCWIPSETEFFTRKLYESVHGFREDINFALDYDFYVRSCKNATKFIHVRKFMGVLRCHELSKSSVIADIGKKEFIDIRKNVFGNQMKDLILNYLSDFFLGKLMYHYKRGRRDIKIIRYDILQKRIYNQSLNIFLSRELS